MARIDASIATFFGVQSGLAMGSIYICGSEEQKQKWLPQMQKFDKIGAFRAYGTGSRFRAAGGLTATCKKTVAEGWVLNGEKKNGLVMPHLLTWLLSGKGSDDGEVKGFIVEKR